MALQYEGFFTLTSDSSGNAEYETKYYDSWYLDRIHWKFPDDDAVPATADLTIEDSVTGDVIWTSSVGIPEYTHIRNRVEDETGTERNQSLSIYQFNGTLKVKLSSAGAADLSVEVMVVLTTGDARIDIY